MKLLTRCLPLFRYSFTSPKAIRAKLAIVLTGLLTTIPASAETGKSYAPYLVATNTQGTEDVSLLYTDVGAEITENVLEAQISQTYHNQGESTLECQWVFPSGQMVHIGNVQVLVNGELIIDAFKSDVLILELLPNEKIELTISFTEELNPKAQDQDLI